MLETRSTLDSLREFQIAQLRSASPPIEAFGIGGSLGRASGDQHSDLDFFILYPTDNFFSNLASFPERITHPSPPIAQAFLNFNSHYGFQYTFVLEKGYAIDYFLNCRETLSPTPMRANTTVLLDRTGFLTDFTRQSAEPSLSASCFHRMLETEYLSELVQIYKYIRRQDLPPLLYRIDRLRRVLCALDRLRVLNQQCPHQDADKHLQRDLGSEYVDSLAHTVPQLSTDSLIAALRNIGVRLQTAFQALDGSRAPTLAFLTLTSQLQDNILSSLTCMNNEH